MVRWDSVFVSSIFGLVFADNENLYRSSVVCSSHGSGKFSSSLSERSYDGYCFDKYMAMVSYSNLAFVHRSVSATFLFPLLCHIGTCEMLVYKEEIGNEELYILKCLKYY